MIKVIDGKRYNTEKAELIFTYWNGYSRSDFKFRMKRLYLTQNGAWFIHHEGGPMTDMAESSGRGRVGGEAIEPLSPEDAFGFLQAHSDDSEAAEAIEKYFNDKVVDA